MRCGLLCALWLTVLFFICLILVSVGLMTGVFTTAIVAEGDILKVEGITNDTCRLTYQITDSYQVITVEVQMSYSECFRYTEVPKLYFYNTRHSMVYHTKRTYPAEAFWMTWVLNQVSTLLVVFICGILCYLHVRRDRCLTILYGTYDESMTPLTSSTV